jgi:hypothetical protein
LLFEGAAAASPMMAKMAKREICILRATVSVAGLTVKWVARMSLMSLLEKKVRML